MIDSVHCWKYGIHLYNPCLHSRHLVLKLPANRAYASACRVVALPCPSLYTKFLPCELPVPAIQSINGSTQRPKWFREAILTVATLAQSLFEGAGHVSDVVRSLRRLQPHQQRRALLHLAHQLLCGVQGPGLGLQALDLPVVLQELAQRRARLEDAHLAQLAQAHVLNGQALSKRTATRRRAECGGGGWVRGRRREHGWTGLQIKDLRSIVLTNNKALSGVWTPDQRHPGLYGTQ